MWFFYEGTGWLVGCMVYIYVLLRWDGGSGILVWYLWILIDKTLGWVGLCVYVFIFIFF